MRSVLLVGAWIVSWWPSRAMACMEETFVIQDARTLPSQPSLFVSIASRDGHLPAFTRGDGTPVPYRVRIDFQRAWGIVVDVDIDRGVLIVKPGMGPTRRFDIDPFMTPHTRSIYALDHGPSGTRWDLTWFEVDSDAEWFRIDDSSGSHDDFVTAGNSALGDLTSENRPARITALYSDGREELIYDFHPSKNESSPWAAFALAAAAAVIAKFAQHE